MWSGVFACLGVIVDPDALLTAAQAARIGLGGLTPVAIRRWSHRGIIAPVDTDGRWPRYRWGDLLAAERSTRRAGNYRRKENDVRTHIHIEGDPGDIAEILRLIDPVVPIEATTGLSPGPKSARNCRVTLRVAAGLTRDTEFGPEPAAA